MGAEERLRHLENRELFHTTNSADFRRQLKDHQVFLRNILAEIKSAREAQGNFLHPCFETVFCESVLEMREREKEGFSFFSMLFVSGNKKTIIMRKLVERG